MKIIFDDVKKEGVLIKNDGTEVSRYSYKNVFKTDEEVAQLKADIEKFNITLGQQEEFDDIKELTKALNIHNWDE